MNDCVIKNPNKESKMKPNSGRLKLKGMFHVEHFRKGKLIGTYDFKNAVVDDGLDKILDVMFHDVTKIATWYIGIVNNAGFTGYAAGDNMGGHGGWTEWTSYDEANRVTWTEGAASGQSITNATPVDFTMSASGTVRGLFLTSNNTKSGTTGTLWATADFASTVTVADDDVLKVTYTINAAAA